MAINLNVEKYGAQFQMFAAFADQHKNPDFVVRIEGQKPGAPLAGLDGEPRRIVAKDWDGSGQVWRLKGSRDVNNEVRALFMQTILAVCGAKSKEELPLSVREVLKGGDFDGKGRPLTVRRIKAVTNAVMSASMMEMSGLLKPCEYGFDVYKKKLDYVNSRLNAMSSPKLTNVKARFAMAEKMMNFMKDELPGLIADNPDYEEGRGEHPFVLRKLKNGTARNVELDSLRTANLYVGGKVRTTFHLAENVIQRQEGQPVSQLSDLENPKVQIPAYFERVMQTYVTMAIDLFIECEKRNRLDEFFDVISRTAVCTEAKARALSEFKLEVVPLDDGDGAIADHDTHTPLNHCISLEIDAIIKKRPDLAESDDFADFADEVKANLVGKVRPIEISYKRGGETKFKPVLDIDGNPVVREITGEDIDNIGQACIDSINGD
jgi:hypothetical protein